MTAPTFDNVAAFVRAFTGLPSDCLITSQTRLEADLDVTGDDGAALLEEAQQHFKRTLISRETGVRDTFDLGANEYLFEAEGFDVLRIAELIRWLRREPAPVIRDLTIGELYDALGRATPLANERAE